MIDTIQQFEIILSGGFAIYGLLSMTVMLVMTITGIINWMVKYLP